MGGDAALKREIPNVPPLKLHSACGDTAGGGFPSDFTSLACSTGQEVPPSAFSGPFAGAAASLGSGSCTAGWFQTPFGQQPQFQLQPPIGLHVPAVSTSCSTPGMTTPALTPRVGSFGHDAGQALNLGWPAPNTWPPSMQLPQQGVAA